MPILGIIASSFRSAAGPEGAYDSLATVTVPSGGVASVTFAGIPSGYKHLQIRAIGRTTTAGSSDNAIHIRFNGDSGSNYSYHAVFGDGGSAFSYAVTSSASGQISQLPTAGRTANAFGSSVTDILDYANTSKNKTIRSLCGNSTNDTAGLIGLISSAWYSTSTVTSITLISAATGAFTFAEYSTFALYGVK
jgi:hypothetical protein